MEATPFSRVALVAATLILLVAGPASAQRVIYVDTRAAGANDGSSWTDAFVVLHDALALARDGDEVWVAEGVYRPDQGTGITPGDRTARFLFDPGVSILGGFIGGESTSDDRTPDEHPTVLSGDLAGNDPVGAFPSPDSLAYAENSYSILHNRYNPNMPVPPAHRTVLDGLTIRGAHSPQLVQPRVAVSLLRGPCTIRGVRIVENMGEIGAWVRDCDVSGLLYARNNMYRGGLSGGGLRIDGRSHVTDSRFEDNHASRGGGILVDDFISPDTVFVSRSDFIRNSAWDGGAMESLGGAVIVVVSSRFIGNQAKCGGGAIEVDTSTSIVVVNSLFDSNYSGGDGEFCSGGAVEVYEGTFTAYNSTFVGNYAQKAGQILGVIGGEARVINSILSSKDTAPPFDAFYLYRSSIEVGWVLVDEPVPAEIAVVGPVIVDSPRFVDPPGPDGKPGTLDDDYSLAPDSPGIDAGNNDHVPPDYADLDGDLDRGEATPLDLDGNGRLQRTSAPSPVVDLGALESAGSAAIEPQGTRPAQRSNCPFSFFPNPSRGRLTVIVSSPEPVRLELFDLLGRQVVGWRPFDVNVDTSQRFQMDTSSLVPGVYVVRGANATSFCSRQLIHL